ncbi:hypothetical protein [Streptomyces ortus]|uniref:XRE family transcriptional regulator n=1 Tax=Streptomyces ortus TaxID=2867268 RepID=A0ABT3UZQ6_9ACTN|nr:hypothetical protein [Streptomyces ortus]MCX4232114.1 hypothetical protein [Streptomyces ortus]
MSKIDVARAAEIQINTYDKVEGGKSVRPLTYEKIETVIHWARGSCDDFLRQNIPPTPVEDRPSGAVVSPVRPGDLAADVGDAVQDALIAVSDDLTASQIRELKRQVVDEVLNRWKKRGIDHN